MRAYIPSVYSITKSPKILDYNALKNQLLISSRLQFEEPCVQTRCGVTYPMVSESSSFEVLKLFLMS